ncbi:sialidase family protein [Luteolibacter marinus]|uniref:sialidase family protein n=1 Tax=Luteolibacter marinus TaxID=2776705 RepID=UPI001866F799|nr:sialidase family protein [Luteolibacter marinus]
MRTISIFLASLLTIVASANQDLFVGTGKAPRHTYRIPTLAVTSRGTLLAFAELRRNGAADHGDIETVMRRSTDGGRSWSEEVVLQDFGPDTIGNACPIVDPATGDVLLLTSWTHVPESKTEGGFGPNARHLYLSRSHDDGLTWSRPEDITRQVKDPAWSWFVPGPGKGSVISKGQHQGRLVIGVNHREADGYRAHAIYSDDSGKSWKSSSTYAALHTNECELAELANGDLMLNMRNHGSPKRDRAVAISKDGGETWGETVWDTQLPEPQCMAAFVRHSLPAGDKPGLLLFCNPASRKGRENLTLRGSTDEGKTWPLAKVIKEGDAAYSHLGVLPDGTIAIAYETDGYRRIAFTTVQPGDLAAP